MSSAGIVVTRSIGPVHERLGYLSPAVPDLFCRTATPAGATGSVLIVPTVSAALRIWTDRESRLMQGLHRRGLGTITFELRGQGRSFLAGDASLETLSEDVSAAMDLADDQTVVVGIGGGAILAVPEARKRGLPAANWGAYQDFSSFFGLLARYRVETGMGLRATESGSTELLERVSSDLLHEELERAGRADLSGFALPAATYRALEAVALSDADIEYCATFPPEAPAEAVAQWAAITAGSS
ncbi:MAG TPA: hypothetical protein VFT85_05570 [Acidimicrobiia bacterium]|nr:hypothetical protein [Acidimicrobiia bacterium]